MGVGLPLILEREPLVDAVFEVRLKNSPPLADILAGYLAHVLNPKPVLTRMPGADFPQALRASDPNLQFVPLQRLEWGDYFIALGERNIAISCKMPYPKWPQFRKAIQDILTAILPLELRGTVERYAVKYVNVLEAPTIAEQLSKIRLDIQLGDVHLENEFFSLNMHHREGDVLHLLTVVAGAQAAMSDGRVVFGIVVDVDSIRQVAIDFNDFIATLDNDLHELRQLNKAKFFSCLRQSAVEEMGPIYE